MFSCLTHRIARAARSRWRTRRWGRKGLDGGRGGGEHPEAFRHCASWPTPSRERRRSAFARDQRRPGRWVTCSGTRPSQPGSRLSRRSMPRSPARGAELDRAAGGRGAAGARSPESPATGAMLHRQASRRKRSEASSTEVPGLAGRAVSPRMSSSSGIPLANVRGLPESLCPRVQLDGGISPPPGATVRKSGESAKGLHAADPGDEAARRPGLWPTGRAPRRAPPEGRWTAALSGLDRSAGPMLRDSCGPIPNRRRAALAAATCSHFEALLRRTSQAQERGSRTATWEQVSMCVQPGGALGDHWPGRPSGRATSTGWEAARVAGVARSTRQQPSSTFLPACRAPIIALQALPMSESPRS